MVKSSSEQEIQPSLGCPEIRGSVAHPSVLTGTIQASSRSRMANLRPLRDSRNEQRLGQRPVHSDQVHAWRIGHRYGHHDQAPATHNERRREQWPEHHDHPPCSAASFEVNSKPHTVARPSVRLCVGPELARCVHIILYRVQFGII